MPTSVSSSERSRRSSSFNSAWCCLPSRRSPSVRARGTRHGWWGFCIAIPAAVLLFTARWQLGKSFSVTPQARELVTWGIYSKIRNPIYVFSALLLVGVLFALQYRYALLLLLVLIPIQIARAHQEAQVLEARFGEEYRNYRKGTWF